MPFATKLATHQQFSNSFFGTSIKAKIPNTKTAFGIVLSEASQASYFTRTFFTSFPDFKK